MRLIFSIVLTAMLISFSKESSAQIDSVTLNSSSITGNVVLNKTTKYLMKGFNYVRDGGTITIPEGTVIMGEFFTKGTLIIERGGKIFANGTADAPVIFTSQKPVGQRAAGDWGGVIILGRATINTSTGAATAEIEGFGPGLGPLYGGNDDNDNSGVFRFVRLEFPGINLTGISGNEINGLTMGGVGRQTVIEYVQVSYSGDDSFEWFGGTVNCKYLIAYKGLDDDWDCDNGFRGRVQYGLSIRDKDIADVSQSNGFEIDNNNNTPANTNGPRTRPFFSNMTVIGPFETTTTPVNSLFQRGAHLRRNMQACIYNSLIMGWRTGTRFDGSGVINDVNGGVVQVNTNIYSGMVTALADETGGSITGGPSAYISNNNTTYSDNSSVQLTNPFAIYPNVSLPGNNVTNWIPLPGSPALSGANFSNPNLSGFEAVSYRGAFGTNNWTYNWSQFNPINYQIPVTSNYTVTLFPEGFYNTGTNELYSSDTVRIYLRNNFSPYSIVDSAAALVDKTTLKGKFVFKNASSGTYYLHAKHRNSIETWSKSSGEPFVQAAENYYDFTTSASQAFGDNQKSVAGKYGIYSGDVNQDAVIDLSDLVQCYNDVLNFGSGYIVNDANGDGVADLSDLIVIDNNSSLFIFVIRP